jgi:hypothetical protein
VFYDMPFPARAVTGLAAYKALRFAVGIAVAAETFSYGLTPAERAVQQQQLRTFVGGNIQLFKNLGTEGWSALPQIAQQIADSLPDYYYQGVPIPRYTWCGWKNSVTCGKVNYHYDNCAWPDPQVESWGCRTQSVATP